jgi:hypothetical protein
MISLFRKAVLSSVLVLIAVGVAASASADFTPGYYYATGWVEPKGPSLHMQGSHKLVTVAGANVTLLSSDFYGLTSYETRKVRVLGWVEPTVEGGAYIMDVYSLKMLEPYKYTTSFSNIETGIDSQFEDTRMETQKFVIRDAATWRLFFQLHKPGGEAPYVDFTRYQILGAYMGPAHTVAHTLSITKVEKAGTTTYVTTRCTVPPPDSRLPYLMNPIHPFSIARIARNTGPTYFDGKRAKVLTKTDLVGDANALVGVGHMVLPADIDRSKLKVGVFGMNVNFNYFVWPGTFPTDVKRIPYSDYSQINQVFAKAVKPAAGVPSADYHYALIVWEDLNDDNSTAGERMATSTSFIWTGTWWTAVAGAIYPAGIGSFVFDLTQ